MPFAIEPQQKPQEVPDNAGVLLMRNDPSRAILDRVFFIGTEPYNIGLISDYAWIYPKLTDEIRSTNLLSSQKVYFFGQTEPAIIDGKQIFIPVLICVKSPESLPFYLSLTSVQASSEEIIELRSLMLSFTQIQISTRKPQMKGRKATQVQSCEILQLKGRVSAISKDKENDYTYSNIYLPFTAYIQRQLDQLKENNNCDVEIKCNGKKVSACIDKNENLESQAKFVYLKYVYQLDMENVDLSTAVVDEEIVTGIVDQFKLGIDAAYSTYLAKRRDLQNRLEESQRLAPTLANIQVVKYYPIDADGDVAVKTSKFVNRYFGNATKVVY